jgi:hypothetical protein
MRDYNTNAAGESSTPHATTSDPSVAKNNAYHDMEDDGTRSIVDNTRLADLGYRPELKRDFSALETFGVAFSIM